MESDLRARGNDSLSLLDRCVAYTSARSFSFYRLVPVEDTCDELRPPNLPPSRTAEYLPARVGTLGPASCPIARTGTGAFALVGDDTGSLWCSSKDLSTSHCAR